MGQAATQVEHLEDRYHLQKVSLGRGSFGSVWRAVDRQSNRYVAVKQLDLKARPGSAEDVEREVAMMRACRHENLLRVLDSFQEPNRVSLVVEYCDGGDFGDKLKERAHEMQEPEVADWVRQMLSAVAMLHSKGICHRDIKPDNFLVANAAVLKLADFGMAVFVPPGQLLSQKCGTPAFMSPEQHRLPQNSRGYTFAVDVWAVGVSMYMLMFAGLLPFVDCSGRLDIAKLQRGALDISAAPTGLFAAVAPAAARPLQRSFSEAARALCAQMVEPDQSRRVKAAVALKNPWFSQARGLPREQSMVEAERPRPPSADVGARTGRAPQTSSPTRLPPPSSSGSLPTPTAVAAAAAPAAAIATAPGGHGIQGVGPTLQPSAGRADLWGTVSGHDRRALLHTGGDAVHEEDAACHQTRPLVPDRHKEAVVIAAAPEATPAAPSDACAEQLSARLAGARPPASEGQAPEAQERPPDRPSRGSAAETIPTESHLSPVHAEPPVAACGAVRGREGMDVTNDEGPPSATAISIGSGGSGDNPELAVEGGDVEGPQAAPPVPFSEQLAEEQSQAADGGGSGSGGSSGGEGDRGGQGGEGTPGRTLLATAATARAHPQCRGPQTESMRTSSSRWRRPWATCTREVMCSPRLCPETVEKARPGPSSCGCRASSRSGTGTWPSCTAKSTFCGSD